MERGRLYPIKVMLTEERVKPGVRSSSCPLPTPSSAENLFHYVGGKCLAASRGEAWREIKGLGYRPAASRSLFWILRLEEPRAVRIDRRMIGVTRFKESRYLC